MSGALIQLVSKGVQDVYLNSDEGHSYFRMKFNRHTNFSQAPKFIQNISDKDSSITIPVLGDIINGIWCEGNAVSSNLFYNSTVSLYIGGQKVDSQHYDYFSEIWPVYLSETYTKSENFTNKQNPGGMKNFLPFHFFFCDHGGFLPLVALQYHQVEIKIDFDETQFSGFTEADRQIKVYGNYIYLDKDERESMAKRQIDFVITQVQRAEFPFSHVNDNTTDIGGHNDLDISIFNHPVKSLFFGYGTSSTDFANDRFTFKTGDIQLNGTPLLENMSPMYFHVVQNYYKSKGGSINYVFTTNVTFDTRFFAYHFCLDASSYNPSGTCNFSRLDHAKLIVRGAEKGSLRPTNQPLYVYAVNYNVLRFKDGLAGILFGS
tara:strand:+ start:380 stop:1504 length:1125 start_codon:yes stop_codon:yes gene_type:complete